MFESLRRWRRRRIASKHSIPDDEWQALVDEAPVIARLGDDARRRLRELTLLFLHEKRFVPAGGLDLTPRMRLRTAALACLPVLELGLDWYDDFKSVIVYPAEFVVPGRSWVDDDGIEHTGDDVLSGEAWEQGGVILAWDDVAASGHGTGYNVVVHECSHKLDMQDGAANGMPPLHRGMDPGAWTDAFSEAWSAMQAALDTGETPWLDPYAAEDPSEFFAVCCEAFFETPRELRDRMPGVHAQLAAFFRQDPAGTER